VGPPPPARCPFKKVYRRSNARVRSVCKQGQHLGRFGGLDKMTVETGFSRAGLMFVVAPAGEGGNEHA